MLTVTLIATSVIGDLAKFVYHHNIPQMLK